jgi:hypothetical protein
MLCRWGSGFNVDLFSPQQGSVVQMINTLRLRLVCTPSNQLLANSKNYPRPGSSSPQELSIIPEFNYSGHTFYDSLHFINFSRKIVPDPEVSACSRCHQNQYL